MMAEHYVQRVSAGLIIAEATNVVPQSIAWDCAPGIFTSEQIDAWAPLVRAVHAAGGRIALQLWHGGRVASDRSANPQPALSPSGVNENLDAITVWGSATGQVHQAQGDESRAMTLQRSRHHRAFGEAARACKEVGFDAIELHGANGYLPHQFLSPFTQPPRRRLRRHARKARALRDRGGAGDAASLSAGARRHAHLAVHGLQRRDRPLTRCRLSVFDQ